MRLLPHGHTPEAVAQQLIEGLENGTLTLGHDTDEGDEQPPTPAALVEYEKVQPGFVNRVLEAVEEETAHRRRMELLEQQARADVARRGQLCGLAIVVTAVVAGSLTASLGLPWVSALVGVGGLLGTTAIFVLGRLALPAPQRTRQT